MIDISDSEIVVERRDGSGRFALFTNTDLPAGCPLPWWSVMLDHGGDASAILVRLDEASGPVGAWTAHDLTRALLARQTAESFRRPSPLTTDMVRHLEATLAALTDRRPSDEETPLSLHSGWEPSPYPWTIVQRDDTEDRIDFCPDPAGRGEGIGMELLLIVLDQLLHDSLLAHPDDVFLVRASVHIQRALSTEARRAGFLRTRT